jgi:WxcM-like, C-terminal.
MGKKATVWNSSIIQIRKNSRREGNISIVENGIDLPFDVKRVFYIYDIPGGESRGAHSHKECHQFLVAASGAFEVLLDDGRTQRLIQLNRPYHGLHIPPGLWASEINFSSGAVCLVLTSHKYDESDYIRTYEDYLKYINE